MGPRIDIDEDWLREKYVEDWLSAVEISELVDASPKTIRRRLEEYGITRADGWQKKPLDSEFLQREYIENRRSCRDIASDFDFSREHVRRSLEFHGIERRARGDANRQRYADKCSYRTHTRGHVIIGAGRDMVYEHQLVAIAHGADPHKLFSDGGVVHHKNGVRWDNRPENLEVLDGQSEHAQIHYPESLGKVNARR